MYGTVYGREYGRDKGPLGGGYQCMALSAHTSNMIMMISMLVVVLLMVVITLMVVVEMVVVVKIKDVTRVSFAYWHSPGGANKCLLAPIGAY